MPDIEKLVSTMRNNPKAVRFFDLAKVCTHYFGKPRIRGSHYFFSTPWQGEPLINIQDDNGNAKAYQVKNVIAAIDILEGMNDV